MSDKQVTLRSLADAIVNMDEVASARLAAEALAAGIDAREILSDGIMAGMELVSQKCETGEYFVPELLVCSDALYSGLAVLRPHLVGGDSSSCGRVVLGVVEGDSHDIGKNIVKIMLEGSGFIVTDLGCNVPLQSFVDAAIEQEAHVIALSALMTTAMDGMGSVVDLLVNQGVRARFKVIVGGAPISQAFANKIGADGYAPNASEAVRLVRSLLAQADTKERVS